MSKIVLAGIVGSLTVVTGLLFYSANLRDSKSSDEDESDTETEPKPKTRTRTRINEREEEKEEDEELEVIEDKPISKKRERHATTSKKVPMSKSNTRRNRNR